MILSKAIVKSIAPDAMKPIYIYTKDGKKEGNSENRILLIACLHDDTWITINQSINELVELSRYSIEILNASESGIPPMPRISERYLAVIVHNTACYNPEDLEKICERILNNYSGIKVLIKQDEHYCTNRFADIVKKYKFDLVLTIWSEDIAKKIYIDNRINPKTKVMQYLTGYMPESYKKCKYPFDNRKIDVGYRGSVQPVIFGRLAYEKKDIGEKFSYFSGEYNLRCDISSRWDARFSGQKWLDFLGQCKACLGVESGSDIVDVDGNISRALENFEKENPTASELDKLNFLSPYEGKIKYRAISPRHFEAAACKTLQILYEGEYQAVFIPYRHYVPLKRDYSNIDEVVKILRDERKRKEIVECAFNEIVLSEKYSYKSFVRIFDNKVSCLLEKRLKQLND